jgi:hypothetical protein
MVPEKKRDYISTQHMEIGFSKNKINTTI